MSRPTFSDQFAAAQQQPAYWSYLATLEFVDALVAEMDAQGVNAAELARRIGTSRAWVSRVLAGQCNLTVASMSKLAFALGMRLMISLEPASSDAAARPGAAAKPASADRPASGGPTKPDYGHDPARRKSA